MIGVAAGLIIWGAAIFAAYTRTPMEPVAVPTQVVSKPMLNVHKPLIPIKGESLSVIGRVVDLQGNPLEGVSVYLRDSGPTMSPESRYEPVTTDGFGWFQFFNLTPGKYAFVAIQGHTQLSGVEIIPMLAHTSRLHVRIVLDVDSQVI